MPSVAVRSTHRTAGKADTETPPCVPARQVRRALLTHNILTTRCLVTRVRTGTAVSPIAKAGAMSRAGPSWDRLLPLS
ncbi:hypothetical protein BHE74_00036189 [Ensete ventricosum]|nr:hypothetical protein GW17_00003041 [Ensete ventricosum]RWW57040.1 hypothetical protein BHE74_00036189 [Ensete ventricosum]